VAVDTGADVFRELALEELRRATRALDDLQAARDLAHRILTDFAVPAPDDGPELLDVRVEQLLELEHAARATERRRVRPRGKRRLRGRDRTIHFLGRGVRHPRLESAEGWVVDVAKAAAHAVDAFAADVVTKGLNFGRCALQILFFQQHKEV